MTICRFNSRCCLYNQSKLDQTPTRPSRPEPQTLRLPPLLPILPPRRSGNHPSSEPSRPTLGLATRRRQSRLRCIETASRWVSSRTQASARRRDSNRSLDGLIGSSLSEGVATIPPVGPNTPETYRLCTSTSPIVSIAQSRSHFVSCSGVDTKIEDCRSPSH